MKVVYTCSEESARNPRHPKDLLPGQVYTLAGSGYYYLRTNSGRVCLDTNDYFDMKVLPSNLVVDRVFPNAKVVLEDK